MVFISTHSHAFKTMDTISVLNQYVGFICWLCKDFYRVTWKPYKKNLCMRIDWFDRVAKASQWKYSNVRYIEKGNNKLLGLFMGVTIYVWANQAE